MNAVPSTLISALCDVAGVDVNDVQAITITPGIVRFDVVVRDGSGALMTVGHGDDARVAGMVIELPHTPFPAQPVDTPVDEGAVVAVTATADAEVIRAEP